MQTSVDTIAKRIGFWILDQFAEKPIHLFPAFLFLPPAIILGGLIYILLKLFSSDEGPFLYRGDRLGQNRRIFKIYKIRTLALNTESQLGANLLVPGSGRELRFGTFLRQTRLDELPQLFNIIKGDMSFLGPRPVRPTIYTEVRKNVPNYDRRFMVKPGLIGYSQLFTPHSAPKRIRALIDNHCIKKSDNFREIKLIATAIVSLSRNLVRETSLAAMKYLLIFLHRGFIGNQRKVRRIKGKSVKVFLTDESFKEPLDANLRLLDLNHKTLSLETNLNLRSGHEIYLVLEVRTRNKRKRVKCRAYEIRKRKNNGAEDKSFVYLISYDPISALNRYMLDQYVLRQSIAQYF